MEKTLKQYDEILARCRELFVKKTHDYGTAWRILRPSSLTDQLFIKAKRIRSIEEKSEQKVADPIEGDYMGLVNYAILALVQLKMPPGAPLEIPTEEAISRFDSEAALARGLLQAKNHDYGEAWRDMRPSSITDLVLMKLLRVRQIEDLGGNTLVSEGLEANFQDIINYAVFAMILLGEKGVFSNNNK